MLFTLTSMVLLAAYIVYAVRVTGEVPVSVSGTYYGLEKSGRGKWLFQAAMICPALLLLPAWLDCSPGALGVPAFLSCGGLVFAGAAPAFRLQPDGRIHRTAAAVSGLSAVLWACAVGLWYVPLTCAAASGYFMYRYGRPLFWLELAAFSGTYLSVLAAGIFLNA